MRQQTHILLSAVALLTVISGHLRAQENLPFGPSNHDHNMQLFAPLELDLDNLPAVDQWSGYIFNYDKLFWYYTGERVQVGDPDVVVFAEQIYLQNPQDEGIRPAPYRVFNGLQSVPPRAGIALGDRYEVGYHDGDSGWMITVLDGPELAQTEFYGFVPRAIDGGLPPFIDPDYTGGDDIGPGTGPVGEARAFGFGSVAVNFETPAGMLQGFRDYLDDIGGAAIGTVGGPILYVGNYGMPSFTDTEPGEEAPFFRLADNLDGDEIFGSGVLVDIDGNVVGLITDFGDLHTFNIVFDNVTVRNRTETDGVEAMWSHTMTKRHHMKKHQNNEVTLSWGARYLRLYDHFRVDANGSILHNAFWDTSFANQIIGPQVGIDWINRRQRWTLRANGRFTFGYNQADWNQVGLVGEGTVPGALNQPLYFRPTAFSHGLIERQFSPVAEMRLQARYHIFQQAAVHVGYTGMFIGNIKRAGTSVRYRLPDMGYLNSGTQDILVNGLDVGVEFVY